MTPTRVCECGWRFFGESKAKCPQCHPEKTERQQRIEAAAAQTKRLISWLRFFRHDSDSGIGDTAQRLVLLAKRKSDAHTLIKRLLSQCSCSRVDAVEKLNREYSY